MGAVSFWPQTLFACLLFFWAVARLSVWSCFRARAFIANLLMFGSGSHKHMFFDLKSIVSQPIVVALQYRQFDQLIVIIAIVSCCVVGRQL